MESFGRANNEDHTFEEQQNYRLFSTDEKSELAQIMKEMI
jgi:hypothetical protein